MKFMKLGSKPDSFQSEGDNVRYVSSELATDVIIIVGDVKFYLHKFPLLSKSGRLQKLITSTTTSNEGEEEEDQIQSHEDEIDISEIPGGPASFEICAKFCYGMTVTLNAYNVVAARCAAEFLEMQETVEKGNLVYKIEVFLNSSILQSWKDSIILLQTTRALSNYSEELKITGRCLDSIASKACMDTSKVEWSYSYSKKKNLDNGLRKPQQSSVPKDWWVEDLCDLNIDLYRRAIRTVEARGRVSVDVIGEALHAYSVRRIPGFSRTGSGDLQITDFAKYRALTKTIIDLIPEDRKSVSSGFLTKLLRSSIFLGCDEVTELKNRVGERLDEASLGDVMLYDVDLMQSLVEVFLNSNRSEMARVSVAKLVDGYLAEKSRDSDNLPLQKFLCLAEMVLNFPRKSHDGIYRAIDMFLKEHPEMNKSEKKRICRLMDCRKLSAEACAHAVQNERLPMRVVVQVLFFEQVRANSNNGSSSTGNSTPEIIPAASRSTNTEEETECWDTEDIKALRGELANLRLAKNQQQEEKGKVVKGGGGVSRVFSKLWSGKERSGGGEMMVMSSSGTSSPGSLNNDDSKSSSSTSKKH